MKFPKRTLAVCLSVLFAAPNLWAQNDSDSPQLLHTIEVKGSSVQKDEIGKSRQYTREIVNLYKGKQEIETYKGNSVSDLLGGLPGVYSGDSRNSGALDPNIRGQQGQGRIPVAIDGTEQSITVWRGYAGANNRNYVDPNIISSVYIEKGPSLDRNIRSGIGGSVALKTIDVEDFIPEGKKFGAEIKIEGGNNSIKPRGSNYSAYIGKDYRLLPDPIAAGGGMWRSMFDGTDRIPQRFDGAGKMFTDRAARIAIGTRQEHFDFMLAYAYRNKGNYFSGKKGAEHYGYIGTLTPEKIAELERQTSQPGNNFKPMAAPVGLFYYPGGEVTNTSLNTRSWVGKATFRLPENQSIKLGWRHTDTKFGEIMPSRIFGPLLAYNAGVMNKISEWDPATVKQSSFNIDYAFKPQNSRWIDFNAALWTTRTQSKTNSAGGAPGDVLWIDQNFNQAFINYQTNSAPDKVAEIENNIRQICSGDPTCTNMMRGYFLPKNPQEDLSGFAENTDGRLNAIDGAAYHAKNNRIGFNMSNRIKFSDKLDLTLMGDFQYETLKAHNNFYSLYRDNPKYKDWAADPGIFHNSQLDNVGVPRSGKRQEYNLAFNFRFRPTEWLTLTAGARRTAYGIEDDNLKQIVEKSNYPVQNLGIRYEVMRPLTQQEYEDWREYQRIEYEHYQKTGSFRVDNMPKHLEETVQGLYAKGFNGNVGGMVHEPDLFWNRDEYGKLHVADNPVLNGSIDLVTQVDNPFYAQDPANQPEKIKQNNITYIDDFFYNKKVTPDSPEVERTRKQKGWGWAPMFGATVNLTPNARVYARYTETLRYPSIFEGTTGFSSSPNLGYKWRPEHAKNWEFGYIHDLTGFFPKARYADFRINYFRNKTENIFDRDQDMQLAQFDRQIRKGIELSARFDSGRIFGSLGVVRNLKNQVCDEIVPMTERGIYNISNDYTAYTDGRPVCRNGGMNGNGYLAEMIQPRWSVDAELGARFLENRLEVGTRMHYHSRVYESYQQSMFDYWKRKGTLAYNDAASAWNWRNVAVFDAYLRYQINDRFTAELVGTNLGNRYYLDPFTRSYMPAPGRTVRVGISGKF